MEVFLLFVGLGLFCFLVLTGLALYKLMDKVDIFNEEDHK